MHHDRFKGADESGTSLRVVDPFIILGTLVKGTNSDVSVGSNCKQEAQNTPGTVPRPNRTTSFRVTLTPITNFMTRPHDKHGSLWVG